MGTRGTVWASSLWPHLAKCTCPSLSFARSVDMNCRMRSWSATSSSSSFWSAAMLRAVRSLGARSRAKGAGQVDVWMVDGGEGQDMAGE